MALGRALGDQPLANPVLTAILLLSLLLATCTPYSAYFQGAQYVHFLLGPATAALAAATHAASCRRRIVPPLARWLTALPQ